MRYIFGHKSSSEPGEFFTKDDALDFLHHGLPDQQAFRYRSTRSHRNIDSILFSFEGELLAELVIAEVQKPQPDDEAAYSKARTVYLLDEIRYFANDSLRAFDFGIHIIPHGIEVPDEVYDQIIARAGGFSEIRKRPE